MRALVAACFFFITGSQLRQVSSVDSCEFELENTLKTLLTPQPSPSLQLQALRKDILRRFQQNLDDDDLNTDLFSDKRSISSLAHWSNLPASTKRNVEALARAGYIRTLPEDEKDPAPDEDSNYKRSIANLVKNGQLPSAGGSKRGLEALARNGELPEKSLEQLLKDLYAKRFIGALAKGGNLPNGYFSSPKRNIAALARDGGILGKRNVAAMLRQDNYANQHQNEVNANGNSENKRSLASIKAQGGRIKRSTDFYPASSGIDGIIESDEYPSPVYQNQNVDDYEELIRELTGFYPSTEKRFLGSVAKTGWFRPRNTNTVGRLSPEKRHIGALARLGWLPTLRNIRRFNRSGRSSSFNYGDCSHRTFATDGKTEDNSISKNALSVNGGGEHYLLQPAVDQIPLKKLFMHPRTHSFISQ